MSLKPDDWLPAVLGGDTFNDSQQWPAKGQRSPPLPPSPQPPPQRYTAASEIDQAYLYHSSNVPPELLYEMATEDNLHRLRKQMVQAMMNNQTATVSSTFVNSHVTGSTSVLTNMWITNSSSNATTANPVYHNTYVRPSEQRGLMNYAKDFSGVVELPDGAKLIFENGNYRIQDKDAKITYKANRNREFNKFLNASDLLEQFIDYLGSLKLTMNEVLQVPIETFIMWLIISAAEADKEDKPEQELLLLEHKVDELKTIRKPRCKCCGQFIHLARKRKGIEFCSGLHMDRWFSKGMIAA
jgi:hypothetical protein